MKKNEIKIIGLVAPKFSGKDTVADYVLEKQPQYIKYSFADPLKRALRELYGFTDEQLWGDLKEVVDERWGITPRRAMEIIGTELLQYDIHNHTNEGEYEVGRETWVKRFGIWLEQEQPTHVIVADVRFKHEAIALKKMGAELWSIERPNLNNNVQHAAEQEYKEIDVDFKLLNNSTLVNLYKKIDKRFGGSE